MAPAPGSTKKGAGGQESLDGSSSSSKPVLLVESYRPINVGPYPEDRPPGNDVRFTSVQVEAVTAGVQPGVTGV